MSKKSSTNHDELHLKVQVWIWARFEGRVRVLILKTRKARGSFWQPVTGSVEKGEALKKAALREAQEETGLRFKGAPQILGQRFRFESRWGGQCEEQAFHLRVLVKKGDTLPQVKLDPHEHTDYEWVSPSAAGKKLAFRSNRRLLKNLMKRLRPLTLKGS